MDVLQAKMVVLRFDMLLLKSCAFKAVIDQRGLLVSDIALSTCQLSLFVQESTQLLRDCRIRNRRIECKPGDTYRIDARVGRTDFLLNIYCRGGRSRSVSRGVVSCHADSSADDPRCWERNRNQGP